MNKKEYFCTSYGEFVELILCSKIEAGHLKQEITDDEEMIPYGVE